MNIQVSKDLWLRSNDKEYQLYTKVTSESGKENEKIKGHYYTLDSVLNSLVEHEIKASEAESIEALMLVVLSVRDRIDGILAPVLRHREGA